VKLLRPTHPYISMRRGFLYLVAIMDWATRKVLTWRLSNTMEADFCVAALEEALAKYGTPEIFNTDQGAQFTSFAFTMTLKDAEVRISMDGRGRWMDNIFIERLWRSLKYECVFLNAFETGGAARDEIGTTTIGEDHTRRWATGRPMRPMLSKSTWKIWRRDHQSDPP
jgi:putative transposase